MRRKPRAPTSATSTTARGSSSKTSWPRRSALSKPDSPREAGRRAARRARPRRRRAGVCPRDRAGLVGAALVPAQVRVDRQRPRAELPPRSGVARRGHLPGEQVPPEREVELGGDWPHAAPPRHGQGNRHPYRRESVPRLRPLQPRDQRPLRRLVPAPPAGQVRRRANLPGRLQRRSGERRRMASGGARDRLLRDEALREARRAPENALPAGVRRRIRGDVVMMLDKHRGDVIMTSPWSYDRSSKACRPISKVSPPSATMPSPKPPSG